ncbi:MAG: CYTH domain-containing protein [Methylococcales bacterium]|nr:CYTH domain-containing protein [Methylococcales bacterium]
MAIEIEHKFLLANDDWRRQVSHHCLYKQGYLNSDKKSSVRVRVTDDKAWLNIKGATIGTSRQEYEYLIPKEEAITILETLCHRPLIEKTRYFVPYEQHLWEVDEFSHENKGLIVAEIELSKVGEDFIRPPWLGLEVTEDVRYYNNMLSQQPYSTWG